GTIACGGSPRPATAPAPARRGAAPTASAAGGDTAALATRSAAGARVGVDGQQQTSDRPVDVSKWEVTKSAVSIFGDSVASAASADSVAAVDSAKGAPVAAPVDDGPTWDIDVRSYETQERVAKYIGIFTGRAREEFVAWLERGTRYDGMIRQKFRAGGLPEDMSYLALVESGYNPHAYSHSAAVGMWQFMAGTARGTGLRVDWWVDERRDPVKSTDAALKFIGWLRDEFGSLYLAAAAYNGGPGRVSRGLTRYAEDLEGTSGDDVFFALASKDYLREETKNYVPQLIAAALVAKSPEKYGLHIQPQPAYAYDSVRAMPSTPLAAVAKATGARTIEIADLNPMLLRGVTPPSGTFYVRVPVGRAAGFDSAYSALSPDDRRAYSRVVSKKGESLASIASKNGRTARQLAWYNPKVEVTKKGRLAAGQTILVPTAAVASAAQDVPDPSIERYGKPASARIVVHVVKHGETINGIARRYHTQPARIRELNHLRRNMIYPGQQLVVKRSGGAASTKRSAAKHARAHGGAATRTARKGGGKKKKAA
ncbi:MAG TPA: transglycosylase SLT domain-containing protein, partial [Gemmatimonadaceae bacterium]|nr:transglycosylase SLT domain-containing protein [Gemmatimonadaceae bacterium]